MHGIPTPGPCCRRCPQLGVKGEQLPTIDGTPPNLFNEIHGDAFAPRNKMALAIDFVKEPPFIEVSPTHRRQDLVSGPPGAQDRAPPLDPEPAQEDDGGSCQWLKRKLIEIKDLQISFGSGHKKFVAVDHVNFDIYKGETFSLVGESGSGKTTIGRAITRINPTSGGDILFKGRKINGKIPKELDQEVIRKCQMIFQDPMASLNERAKVEYIIAEGLLNFHLYKDQNDLHEKVMAALHEGGSAARVRFPLPPRVFGRTAAAHRHCPCSDHGA